MQGKNPMGISKKDLLIQLGEAKNAAPVLGREYMETMFRRAIALSHRRSRIAGPAFGAHTAWELLMHLSLAEVVGETPSLTVLSEKLKANPSTLARIMNVMASEGTISLHQCDDDTEIYAALTAETRLAIMEHILGGC
jgi:hypothetical protein